MIGRRPTRTSGVLWGCVIAGFAVMEFPGVLFFHDKAEPRVLGMPFIYGLIVILWAFMCVVLYVGYRTRWGRPAPQGSSTQAGAAAAEEGNDRA